MEENTVVTFHINGSTVKVSDNSVTIDGTKFNAPESICNLLRFGRNDDMLKAIVTEAATADGKDTLPSANYGDTKTMLNAIMKVAADSLQPEEYNTPIAESRNDRIRESSSRSSRIRELFRIADAVSAKIDTKDKDSTEAHKDTPDAQHTDKSEATPLNNVIDDVSASISDKVLRRRMITKTVNESVFAFDFVHLTTVYNLCVTMCMVSVDGRFLCVGYASKNPADRNDDSIGESIAFQDACDTAAMMYTNSVTSDEYVSTREKLMSAIWEPRS